MGAKTAAVLVIGEEILSGKTTDLNAALLVKELRSLGVSLRRIVVLGDVLPEIAAALRELSATHDFVFTSGGVGPTHDDVTMAAVAEAFGMPLVRHPELEQKMRAFYGERLEERSLRMADVPEGCLLVDSDHLSWPVPVVRNVHVLPGVPEIFRRKFMAIRGRFADAPFHLREVFVDADESTIAARLDQVVEAFPGVFVGSYPRFYFPHETPRWRVKLTLESKSAGEVERATAQLQRLLGPLVVPPDPPA